MYYRAHMAKTKSAKKAQRVSLRRRVFNLRRKSVTKDALKKVEKLIAAKNPAEAAAALPALYKALDKAGRHGTVAKNTAARTKSRITKRIASLAK